MRRILVGVAPVRPEGDRAPLHVPCHVAFLEYGFPQPGVALAVKTTMSFAEGDGPRRSAAWVQARPWVVAPPRPDDDRPLPDDLVPHKPLTDLLVVGRVDVAPTPSGEGLKRPAAVRLGDLDVTFTIGAQRGGRVPLRAPWLGMVGVTEPRLGAAPTPDPMEIGPSFPEDFDFSVFQAAPERLRLETLPHPVSIELVGLDAPDGKIVVDLPALEPHALVDWTEPGRDLQEVVLLADTIVVDLDARVVDIVWRGNFEAPEGARSVDRVLVGFVDPDVWGAGSFGPVLRELARGKFSRAWTREDVVERREPPPLSPEELEMARHEAMESPLGPAPTLTLAEHARIAAELLEVPMLPPEGGRGAPRAVSKAAGPTRASVLEKHGLDEFTWGLEERSLAERLASVPPREGSIHEAWGRELEAAVAANVRPAEHAVIAKDYADLVVQLERGAPHLALAAAGLSLGSWLRLDKKWRAEMDRDPAVRREIEERVASERERLGEVTAPPEEGGPAS